MGHRVYQVRDPRARALERALVGLAQGRPAVAERLELARTVEQEAERLLARPQRRPLHANVEFFTALLLEALQIRRQAFSAMFAVGRAAGWCAHFYEQTENNRLIRPRARYVGPVID